jgi:hypothetical protein
MLEEYVKNVKNMNILYDRKKEIPVKNVPL